ncbi:MAG: hypothetical protein M3R26_00355 [Actinomycetota bacterium]|nr:hypothetical protein [Actinomycetota bacterium]MDQ2980765.1 hypothetical protein [Actinomycetota bacterium]
MREPSRVAPGGGPFNATYYLPERFARRAPEPVPEADRSGISAALGRPIATGRARRSRFSAASFRVLEPDLRMYAGEARGIVVEVTNDSGGCGQGARRGATGPAVVPLARSRSGAARLRRRALAAAGASTRR